MIDLIESLEVHLPSLVLGLGIAISGVVGLRIKIMGAMMLVLTVAGFAGLSNSEIGSNPVRFDAKKGNTPLSEANRTADILKERGRANAEILKQLE